MILFMSRRVNCRHRHINITQLTHIYIGASAGTTVSHVSDIVGPTGKTTKKPFYFECRIFKRLSSTLDFSSR